MEHIHRLESERKHIIIAGAPRAGKTTLARIVSQMDDGQCYIHYKMDAIKRAVFDMFCQERKGDWNYASDVVAKLIQRIVQDNERESMQKDYFIFDTPHVYPDTLRSFDKNQFLIVFLGYFNCNLEEKVEKIRRHDRETCWTNQLSDRELYHQVEQSITYSREMKEQCMEHGFAYFDVSYDMMDVLESAKQYIADHWY